MADLFRRSMIASLWRIASLALQLAAQAIVITVMARHLSPEDFGLAAVMQIAINFGLLISDAGFAGGIVQRNEVSHHHTRVAATATVLLSLTVCALLVVAARPIAVFFRAPGLETILPCLAASLVIVGVGAIPRAMLERELEFRKITLIDSVGYILGYATVGVSLAIAGFGVWSIVWATLAERSLRTLGSFFASPIPITPSLRRKELRELVRFGAGMSASRFFTFVGFYGDTFVIGRVLGPITLGSYDLAFRLMNLPVKSLGEVIDRVMFPAISRVQETRDRAANAYLGALSVSALIMLPLAAMGVVLAPELVTVVLGPNWSTAVVPFQILLVAAPFRISVRMADALAQGVGAVYAVAVRKATYAILVLGLSAGGAILAGIEGAAVAVALATAVNWLMMSQLALRSVNRGWGDASHSLTPAIVGSIIVIAIVVPSAACARYIDLHPVAVVAICGACGLTSLLALVVLAPGILGTPALWVITRIANTLPTGSQFAKFLNNLVRRAGDAR